MLLKALFTAFPEKNTPTEAVGVRSFLFVLFLDEI